MKVAPEKPILFCNIGWMRHYKGNGVDLDQIKGGGSYVKENGTGHEVCNFLACSDGYVYGHVERTDRKINVKKFGGKGDRADGVDVVWTATDPVEHGRRVVGWYRDATVFRERQDFMELPSPQHLEDNIKNYRIRALATNMVCLKPKDRKLVMDPEGERRGWMGQTPWWVPSPSSENPDIIEFVKQTRTLLEKHGVLNNGTKSWNKRPTDVNTPGAASNFSERHVDEHESQISPRHNNLQNKFKRFLEKEGKTNIRPNVNSVDLRYQDAIKGTVLVEVKPCELTNVRYAIRTAIGQLFDYRQRYKGKGRTSLLIVVEAEPTQEDQQLATSNGFGIAYLAKEKFRVVWPGKPED